MSSRQTRDAPRGNNVALVGFRCSGKNTVGESLARRLGWAILDTDQRIQEICGQSIASLVERNGWERFRMLEYRAVREVKPREQRVIITGGGVVEQPENIEHLRRSGMVVFLEATMEDILRRMAADESTPVTRPGLTGLPMEEEVQLLLEKRTPLYHHAADLVVNTSSQSVEVCVDRILKYFQQKNF
ncbi:MAG: shikimate kinase [Deltaproteobacteria bacterium]|nr:shikimate kinase [Deltaproteobacteria bacterium]MBW2305585.1 shikimate kinase [Deltaproteobacteria bacterium]